MNESWRISRKAGEKKKISQLMRELLEDGDALRRRERLVESRGREEKKRQQRAEREPRGRMKAGKEERREEREVSADDVGIFRMIDRSHCSSGR